MQFPILAVQRLKPLRWPWLESALLGRDRPSNGEPWDGGWPWLESALLGRDRPSNEELWDGVFSVRPSSLDAVVMHEGALRIFRDIVLSIGALFTGRLRGMVGPAALLYLL